MATDLHRAGGIPQVMKMIAASTICCMAMRYNNNGSYDQLKY